MRYVIGKRRPAHPVSRGVPRRCRGRCCGRSAWRGRGRSRGRCRVLGRVRVDQSTLEPPAGCRHRPASPSPCREPRGVTALRLRAEHEEPAKPQPSPRHEDEDEEEEEEEEEEYPKNEPKRAEGLGTEQPDQSGRGVQRLEWLPRAPGSPSAAFQDAAPAPAFPVFRKSLPAKSDASARAEPDFAAAPDWAPPKAGRAGRPKRGGRGHGRDDADAAGVFTCIECSIYFRRREHLLEHTLQHSRGCAPRGADAAGRCRFCCAECGWAFGDAAALERHKRQHQESREKIIEEIQKLNEFPDEGREARLQCPKCVFGTNSSKIFVQHAKMHVKERKEQGSRGSGLFGELRDGAGHGPCKAPRAEEAPGGKAPSACVLCGFPAPNAHLKEHLRFAHSHLSWQPDAFQDDPNQPGTSRDSYSPARSAAEFFGKTERRFPAPCRESSSLYDPPSGRPIPGWTRAPRRSRRRSSTPGRRRPIPEQTPAFAGFSSPKSYSHSALQQLRKRAATQEPEGDGDNLRGRPEEPRASEEQRRQLRMMVPVVLLHEAAAHPKAAKRPRGKPPKKKKKPPAAPPEEPLPLDVLLLESPLEAPLELEELLGSEAAVLRNEERKCPYCPDRFHNGIGLANHVRGHLNRVGVSYNVRHFISAEQVKAIEQKFSFQKKKKKVVVANFDPGTFSLMRCEFCGAGFDTRAGLSSHARAHLRDFGITNWELTVSPIHILKELLATSCEHPALLRALAPSPAHGQPREPNWESREPNGEPGAKLESREPPFSLIFPFFPIFLPFPAPSLTTCEVCGACFETRKGLSSHARSHLRQLGVAESESSGAPIDLLYELVRHKTKPDGAALAKKSASPKEPAAPPRALLLLPKAEGSLNKAIKSPPGFSKCLAQPGSPGGVKKAPGALPASPKGAEEKGTQSPAGRPRTTGPLNLTSGSEPCRDIRCEFCGEFFENRKGLSSHARSHLRQMGVTEWYVNGSPIDTLREILTRRRSGHPKALPKSLLASLAPLEPRPPPELHLPPGLAKKVPAPLSPPGAGAASPPPPPTARKVFPGLQAPSLQKKLKQDQLRVEIKRELMAGGGGGGAGIHPGEAPAPPDPAWAAHEEMAPLNLSSRADPVRDIRCEFCGEFFENRKGLSSHARSHLRQMGVTEWSVNGSPIDTLREILRKKSKPCLIKKEPAVPPGLEAAPGDDEGLEGKGPAGLQAPGKALPPALALAPLGGSRPGKPGSALALAPLGAKNAGAFLAPKRPLAEERLGGHGEAKHKGFELGFKAKALHDKASAEACCELCGLYFENRKALASHARAHLRQFGVTEWCVNGSPIETLREWIRHRPHKAGAFRTFIQGGPRPFSKKFRGSAGPRGALALPPGPFLAKGGLGADTALGECGKGPEGAERGLGTALGVVKFPRKLQEPRPPRPVPALVPRPPQTSLVKFVGNIYTLKCRFCEVEFQGPLSIQEEFRHLQRHILDMNFSKADPCRSEAPPEPPALAEAP
ncbi:LOW QUALITY PROTEIN: protein Wiz [Acridotheres tristis]